MSGQSAIEWTDATWNPVTGCTRVSPGCAHCYIERTPPFRMAGRRFTHGADGATTGVVLHEDRLEQPLRWRKPRRVFVNSLSDLFHEDIDDGFIDRVFATMAATPRHTYQVLTKRPERARDYFNRFDPVLGLTARGAVQCQLDFRSMDPRTVIREWPLPNVWVGVSIENARYTWRADVLREIPAAVRFISAEPLLGSLFETKVRAAPRESSDPHEIVKAPLDLTGIDWVIVGGESGPGARGMDLTWARELVTACREHDVAPFVKQLGTNPYHYLRPDLPGVRFAVVEIRDRKGGDWNEWPTDLRVREFPGAAQPAAEDAGKRAKETEPSAS